MHASDAIAIVHNQPSSFRIVLSAISSPTGHHLSTHPPSPFHSRATFKPVSNAIGCGAEPKLYATEKRLISSAVLVPDRLGQIPLSFLELASASWSWSRVGKKKGKKKGLGSAPNVC